MLLEVDPPCNGLRGIFRAPVPRPDLIPMWSPFACLVKDLNFLTF